MKKLKKQLSLAEVGGDETIWLTRQFVVSTAGLFDDVLDRCGILDEERVAYREILARHAEANLVAAMWKGLEKEHIAHLAQFMEQSFVISPEKDHVAILMDFTCLYPALREKAYTALDKFFDEFVEDVRRAKGA